MHENVSYAVKSNFGCSDIFSSSVGVKQGCVLSPMLFNCFLYDLPPIFSDNCDPVSLCDAKISCLMYADDLVLVSQSSVGLQNALNELTGYCKKWNLTVNLNKTRILLFYTNGHYLKKYNFCYDNCTLEVVNSYCYLGIVFTPAGNFKTAIERLADQAQKAAFKLSQLNIRDNIKLAFKLFQILVFPILSYCSEIWCPLF